MSSPMPTAARASGPMRWWVVEAGWVTMLLASPRLLEIGTSRSAFRRAKACSRPALDLEGHDRAAVLHLPARQRRLRVGVEEGVDDPPDAGPALQPARDLHRRPALALDADRQRFQALQQHPGVEGAHAGAGVADEGLEVLVAELARAEDRPAEAAPLPVDMLGGGIDDDNPRRAPAASAKAAWRTHCRSPHLRPGGVRQLRDRLQVDDVELRVGRRLQEDRPGRPGQRPLPGGEVVAVDQFGLDAVARQDMGADMGAGAEERTGADQPVARPQQAEQRG